MAQQQQQSLRRSRRIGNLRQSHIVGNHNNVMTVQVNEKALPVNHGPPWSLSELEGKYVIALRTMCRAYNIVEGHKWKKADLKKALYDYGKGVARQPASAEPATAPRDPS